MMVPNISNSRALEIIEQFPMKQLLVIGDIMLDRFIWGEANRISPEAPVPVVEIRHESAHLGGAGNVIHNLVSLGARASIFSIVGDDEAGRHLTISLEAMGVDTSGLLLDPSRPTTMKTRIIAHNQQVVRADRESRQPVDPEITRRMIDRFSHQLDATDGIVISDYDKGAITPRLLELMLPLARQSGKPVFIDPKIRNFKFYSPATILKPNQREAEQIAQMELTDEASLRAAGQIIRQLSQCDHLLITRGQAGMTLFSGEEIIHIPTAAQEVYDVTGAGDTTMAVLGLAFISGASALESAILANYAASVVIAKVGTATVHPHEILNAFGSSPSPSSTA